MEVVSAEGYRHVVRRIESDAPAPEVEPVGPDAPGTDPNQTT